MGTASTLYGRRIIAFAASALLATSAILVGAAPPSFAAPPANDSILNARDITGIPTTIVQQTREATVAASDGDCVGGRSVWYRFRPASTGTARVVTVGSDFPTQVTVFRGPQDNRTVLTCNGAYIGNGTAVEVQFEAGATYWIAVSTCCGPTGGRSVLTLYRPRPTATSASLGPVETGAASGRIYASGTVRCGTPSVTNVSVTVSQRLGTMIARGTGVISLGRCDGTARPWAVRVDSETAVAFQEGLASVIVRSENYDGFSSSAAEQVTTVTVGSNPNRAAGR